jgi:alkylation response protein AidB-like acyl-CoA dehydrogenase
MEDFDLLQNFERMLDGASPPEVVRAVEAGGSAATLWATLEESGFLDLLVPEAAGGAGISLGDAAPLIEALGAWLVPAPVAQTMAARALLAAAGHGAPPGPILLATAAARQTAHLPFAEIADHALVELTGEVILIRLTPAMLRPAGLHASRTAALVFPETPEVLAKLDLPNGALRALGAVLRAAEIAGMAAKALDITIAYANERVQFGKAIGKQQAVQQQLAVMAEQAVLARMAGRLGCASGLPPGQDAAAAAKQVASAAVPVITGIAHAMHGAIGISEEYKLQLYTRRLLEWRLADGAEGYWASRLGASRLHSDAATSIDFVRGISPV